MAWSSACGLFFAAKILTPSDYRYACHTHFAFDDSFHKYSHFRLLKIAPFGDDVWMMRSMPFNVLPRYHPRIWRDLTISHTFPALCGLYKSTPTNLSLQMEELLQKCYFYFNDVHSFVMLLFQLPFWYLSLNFYKSIVCCGQPIIEVFYLSTR